MARWFWWFAATLVVTLLFVGGDCLRKPVNENVEGHDTTIQSRGGSRFNLKAEKKIVTTPVPFTTLTRSTRRGTTRREIPRASFDKNHSTTLKNHGDHDKNIGSIKTDKLTGTSRRRTESLRKNGQLRRESLVNDLTKAATEDRRYLPEVDDKRPIKFQDETNLETPVELSPNDRVNQRGRLTSRGFNSKNIERRSDNVELKRPENSQSIVPTDDLKQRSTFMSRKSSFVESQIPGEAINRATENPRNSKKRFTERSTEKQDSVDLKLENSSKKNDFTQKKSAERLRGSLREKVSTTLSPRVNRRGSTESKNINSQSRETRTESRYNNDRKKPEQSTGNIQPTRKSETPRKMEKFKKQEITQKLSENNKIKSDVKFVIDELSTVAVERVMTTTEAQIFPTVLPTVRTKTLLKDELPGRNLKLRSRKVTADVHSTTTTTPVAQRAQLTQTRKNYELTMSRRLPSTNSPSRSSTTTTSTTITTVIPSTTTESQSTSSARNIKHSNKTSVTLKTDRELDETENYPPEFKEKLAQLKSSDTKNVSSKTSVQVNEGLRQRLLDVSSSSRSQVNVTNARKVIEPQEKKEEPTKINSSGATRQTGRSPELAIKTLQSKSSEAFGLNEPKTIKGPTRFGTSRPSSTTNRASVTVTFPTIDKKITRPSKIISRKTDRFVEPHKINNMIKYKTENSEIVKTTVPYQPLTPTKETISRSVQPDEKESTTTTKRSVSTVRPVRPWNVEYIDRNWQEPTTRSSVPVKKLDFMTTKRPKAWNLRDTTEQSSIKSTTTQSSSTSINKNPRWKASTFNYEQTTVTSPRNLPLNVQRREFRPRTSTYRRHSGLPVVENLTGIKDSSSVSITPKIPNYNSSDNTENMTHRSTRQEPAIEVSNSTNNNSTSNDTSGISLTSRGNSGNSDSNIFNPSKSTYLISSNASLLEQLRSTVAPLLSALGNRTPIFSGSYSNVHNSNSQSRSTPSGTPPRFSARYRGAELFVRKPNSLDSSGPSSTNPFESTETEVVSDMEMKSSMLSTTEKMENILTTPGPPTAATPSSVTSQGGRIIQDGERDKASRTKEAGGQRSTVYIGQEKFIDYWTDDPPGNNSRVISVKINSVTKAINGLPPSSNQEIIENIQNTTASSKAWSDPLDQIFGIPTNSSSNVSDEPVPSRSSITETSINSFSGVLTPMLNDAQLVRDTLITTTTGEPSVSTTDTTTSPTTTTTTTTTTTSTTPPPTTTTTMSPRPTTSTTTTTSFVPSTFSSTMSTTSTTPSTKPSTTTNIPMQTPFGTTFDDLAFLNSLLQPNEYLASASSTSKSLTEVEQLLANKILSLALAKPGPSRSAKAIQPSNSEPNSLDPLSNIDESSQPIIIDLLQTTSRNFPPASTTTSKSVTWKPVATLAPTKKITEAALTTRATITTTTPKVWTGFPTHPPTTKPTTTSTTTTQKVWTGFPTHPPKSASTTTSTTITTTMPTTTKLSSTKKPIIKSVQKPKPTEAPFRFGAGLLKALFGRNIFAPQTTQRPALTRQPIKTTQKPILSTTTTASPEEDAKFLVELLNEADKKGKDGKKSQSPLTSSDESFLRSILNGQAKVKSSSSSSSTSGNAALIAELLKSQGIEPSTPANQLREQLQSISQTGSTSRPRPTPTKPKQITVKNRIPSSTYPSPLFSNFNFGFNGQRQINSDDNNGGSGGGGGGVRNQMLNAAIGATRVFSQFLGAAITGAAKQFQSFVKNSTRVVVDGAAV